MRPRPTLAAAAWLAGPPALARQPSARGPAGLDLDSLGAACMPLAGKAGR